MRTKWKAREPLTVTLTAITPEGRGVELRLSADELVGALLSLDPSRRLHLLDSGGARGADARLLVAGFDPAEYVEAFGDELRVTARGERVERVRRGSALALLDERLGALTAPAQTRSGPASDSPSSRGPGVVGACFVTLSYELARRFERLRIPALSPAGAPEPDAVLAFCDVVVVHDYARGTTTLAGSSAPASRLRETAETILDAAEAWKKNSSGSGGGNRAEARSSGRAPREMMTDERGMMNEEEVLNSSFIAPRSSFPSSLPAGVVSNFTRAEYEAAVERVREHIRAGDIYQANLTQRLACPPRAGLTPERAFLRLRREHPAAFAAFLRQGARTVVSASPERFLRVGAEDDGGGRVVEAWPIKGTRRRGVNREEDERLRAELLASEKDRAENVMIVDLMRNDLGRVCRYGSVEVAELCALQEHPTLFHLVSKVRGRLREGVTASELLRAAFPCGSITGAPKLRAMEILDEIERTPRGVSMGSVGYFSSGGGADLNVAIRTVTFDEGGAASFHVGGGVVSDSSPAAEYEETLVKARAILCALREDD